MKIIFALTSLYLLAVSQFCRADTLAVFAKDHFTVVTPIGYASGATDERARTNFIKALAQHERAAVTYEQSLPIINPPEWGAPSKVAPEH